MVKKKKRGKKKEKEKRNTVDQNEIQAILDSGICSIDKDGDERGLPFGTPNSRLTT